MRRPLTRWFAACLLAGACLWGSGAAAWEAVPALVPRRIKELDLAWARLKKAKKDVVAEVYRRARQAQKPGWVGMPYWAHPYKGKVYFFGVGVCTGVKDKSQRYLAAQESARRSLAVALGDGQAVVTRSRNGSVTETLARVEVKGESYLDWFAEGEDALFALAVVVR
ncbi:MAG: hypothetical protein HY748_13765 [Elusimicrobia bacterium]|nr:hypothetical protein [Elusimicrobiota bacterium]